MSVAQRRLCVTDDRAYPRVGPGRQLGAVSDAALQRAFLLPRQSKLTLSPARPTSWSRSASPLWRKGETPAKACNWVEMPADCDTTSCFGAVLPPAPSAMTAPATAFEPDYLGPIRPGWAGWLEAVQWRSRRAPFRDER